MNQQEIDRILELKPKYRLELYGCPGIVIGMLDVPKGYTLGDALNDLGWIAECHAEIEARRKPMTNAK